MQEDYEVGEYSADELIEQAGATGGHVGLGGVSLYNRYQLPESFTGRVDYIFRAYIGDGSQYSVEIPFHQTSWSNLLGDLNGDGIVNVLDVIRLVYLSVHSDEANDYERLQGDINFDDGLNVLDVVQLVNIILGN